MSSEESSNQVYIEILGTRESTREVAGRSCRRQQQSPIFHQRFPRTGRMQRTPRKLTRSPSRTARSRTACTIGRVKRGERDRSVLSSCSLEHVCAHT